MAGGSFMEKDFLQPCEELDHPELEGWEQTVQSHGYHFYRNYDKESGLYQYKCYGELEGVPPDVCADCFMDFRYRQQWDSYVKEIYEFHEEEKDLLYWQINLPFPMANRDYVFCRELRQIEHQGRKVWVALLRSVASSSAPERRGVIRVDNFQQACAMTSNGKSGTKTFLYYYDNPKGIIPTWLINWAAKRGIPQFMDTMQKACHGYVEYREKLSTAEVVKTY